jgi:dihydroorotate dehydrogenase (NAD+) catalytic subunit
MTDLCGIPLAHPIINASGTFDAIAARRAFGDALVRRFPFAAFVSKTVTVEPRQGNPPPRLYELPGGMLNSIGLPNKGLEGYLAHDLPELAQLPVPLIVNVMGFTREQVATLVEAFGDRDEVAGLELNVSCPNVETGMIMGADPHETGALLDAVRPHTRKPLIVKLTPNCTSPGEVAASAEAHGADAVSLVNTLRGMAFHPRRPSEPWLGGGERSGDEAPGRGSGGMSGPAVRAIALAQVAEVRSRVSIPIVGMGGVQNGRHAYDFIHAGADVVAVGTESFRDPLAGARVAAELAEIPANSGIPGVMGGAVREAIAHNG